MGALVSELGAAVAPLVGRPAARGGWRRRLRGLTPYLLVAPAVFQALVRDTDFGLSVRNTFVLLAIIIPVEFAVALAMAVLAQSRLRGRGFFLYVWSFPLAISDLAAGLVWLSIFTSHGYLNSALQDAHLIQHPIGFLDYNNVGGLILAVVLAET